MSGTEKEVLRIGKQLDKMVSGEDDDHSGALDLLKSLKEHHITLDILQRTRIGMSVNNLRKKSNNQDVITLAKGLIKGWKKLLPVDGGSSSNKDSKSEGKPPTNSQEEEREPTESKSNGKSAPSSFGEDSVREKCRAMIAAALKIPIDENILKDCDTSKLQEADSVAQEIEDCIFTEFVCTNIKYKSRVRSRISNLQDVKNPSLRAQVLLGDITPERIAKMTSEEMASKELQDMRHAFTKEAINEHQMAQTTGTKSSLMKCHKCGKKNCTYNQIQTRSADEPMTTFVYCNECGNRWKFC